MVEERKAVITFMGNALTLLGPELKVGEKAPAFSCLANDLSEVTLDSFKGKTLLISVVPSLDTPVCDLQTKRFSEEANKLPEDVAVVTVSMDLPFAQKRWCGANDAKRIQTVSDHREASLGEAYGVLIKELRLLARAIFIVNPEGNLQYVEYVKEVTEHPDYDKICRAFRNQSTRAN